MVDRVKRNQIKEPIDLKCDSDLFLEKLFSRKLSSKGGEFQQTGY